jgi:hypothetical protein
MAEEDDVDMNSGGNEHPGEPQHVVTPKPKAPPMPFWVPETRNYVHGSAGELDQRLKAAGIKLRRELLQNCRDDLDHWTALMNPPSVHTALHTLVEMAVNLPSEDRDLFTPLGDHGVCMPLRLMEKYLFPTIRLMHFLEKGKLTSLAIYQGGSKLWHSTRSTFRGKFTLEKERSKTWMPFMRLLTPPTTTSLLRSALS